MQFFWLSFSKGGVFQGVIIVEAEDLATAVTATHVTGVNPGGEIKSMGLPLSTIQAAARNAEEPEREQIEKILALPRLTLITKAMLDAAGIAQQIGE